MTDSTAGIGDPYWFEWSIGLGYVVEMIRSDSGIASVTLQQSGGKGLDDVVVRYTSAPTRCIQVKHTRADASLTFGDMVSGSPSLLQQIADCWGAECDASNSTECIPILLTNRTIGTQASKSQDQVHRPPLAELLVHLAAKIGPSSNLNNPELPPDWLDAWAREWLPQLAGLLSDPRRLAFLTKFRVEHVQGGLSEVTTSLEGAISAVFGVGNAGAKILLARLDHELRIWATSARGRNEAITHERAYQALSTGLERPQGDHGLAPPTPFFASRDAFADKVAATVRSRSARVVFVVGEPGCGKTAVFSSLANRRAPVIDLRFHAYRPITPENQLLPSDAGRTTEARTLWGDLLIQLRELARGRLASLRVPVLSTHLSVDELRDHVLRVAEQVGKERGSPVVIAVDGIDHAARAGSQTNSLLQSLVAPEAVPRHVVFLIGGQPPEGYPAYPVWLRPPSSSVVRMDVPAIALQDIEQLVAVRLSQLAGESRAAVARLIHDACSGNTLSSVFAVEEAAACNGETGRIERALTERKLRSGVESYYDAIWASATQRIGVSASVAKRLAACLCLMPLRITTELLSSIDFRDEAPRAWADLLRELRPLVIEETGGFRLFHNDVRVFLERRLQADVAIYQDSASQIADFLLASPDAAPRHLAAQRLLGIANRNADQARMFTASYVLEAYAVGATLDALADQGLVAARALSSLPADWYLAHAVACGLATTERLGATIEMFGHSRPAPSANNAVRIAELGVKPVDQWNRELINATLSEIEGLLESSLRARAVAVFRRWFGGMTPGAVVGAAESTDAFVNEEANHSLSESLGRLSATTAVMLPSASGASDEIEAHYARGLIRAAPRLSALQVARCFRRVRCYYPDDLGTALSELVKNGAWGHVGILLSRMPSDGKLDWSVRMSAAVAAALLGRPKLREVFVTRLLVDRSLAIREVVLSGGSRDLHPIVRMAELAFVIGFEQPTRNASSIREEIIAVFDEARRDEQKDELTAQALFAAALLGTVVGTRSPAATLQAEPVEAVVRLLLENARASPYQVPYGYFEVAKKLVQGFARVAANTGFAFERLRALFQSRLERGEDFGQHLEAAWSVVRAAGQRDALAKYATDWIGPSGRAWRLPADHRSSLVSRLAALSRANGLSSIAEPAELRLSWASVRHFDDKDYSLMRPKEWFDLLAAREPRRWSNEGLRLLAISREASHAGGNAAASDVESSLVAAAAADCPDGVSELLKAARELIGPEDDTVIEGLIDLVSVRSVTRDDLLAIWCFAVGQLSWFIENDRARLCKLRDALLAAASRLSVHDLAQTLRCVAPNEFRCPPPEVRAEGPPARPPVDVSDPTAAIRSALPAPDSLDSWSRPATVIAAVRSREPAATAAVADIAWQALTTRRERYAWRFDGAERMYETLFPIVPADRHWPALQSLRERVEADTPLGAVALLAEDYDTLCRLAANVNGTDALRRGLSKLLDMHENWLTGNSHLYRLEPFPSPNPNPARLWPSVVSELLVGLLRFGGQLRIQTALRGLYRLASVFPAALSEIGRLLTTVDGEIQRRLLLASESLAQLTGSEVFCESLQAEMNGAERLDVALTAWTALRAASRAHGRPEPQWRRSDDPNRRVVVQVARPLMAFPGTAKGSLLSAGRPAKTLLENLKLASGDDLAALQASFSGALNSDRPAAKGRPRSRGEADLALAHDPEVDLLMKLARTADRSGELGTSPSRLAYAVAPHADPRIFLFEPTAELSEIPIDDALDELVGAGEPAVTEALSRALSQSVGSGTRVIAGVVKTYSKKVDVLAFQDHGWPVSGDEWPLGRQPRRPVVLGGRASAALEPSELLCDSGDHKFAWMTAEVCGLLPFVDGILDLFPTSHWREPLGWLPRPSAPLIWERNGNRVAWAEFLWGPRRQLYPQELIYRQPRAFRWVCSSEEWDRVAALVGPRLTLRRWTRVVAFEDER